MSGEAITVRETSELNAEEARPAQQPAQVSPASRVLKAAAWMSVALASFTLIAVAGREAAHGASTLTIMFYRSWMALGIEELARRDEIHGADIALPSSEPIAQGLERR